MERKGRHLRFRCRLQRSNKRQVFASPPFSLPDAQGWHPGGVCRGAPVACSFFEDYSNVRPFDDSSNVRQSYWYQHTPIVHVAAQGKIYLFGKSEVGKDQARSDIGDMQELTSQGPSGG